MTASSAIGRYGAARWFSAFRAVGKRAARTTLPQPLWPPTGIRHGSRLAAVGEAIRGAGARALLRVVLLLPAPQPAIAAAASSDATSDEPSLRKRRVVIGCLGTVETRW